MLATGRARRRAPPTDLAPTYSLLLRSQRAIPPQILSNLGFGIPSRTPTGNQSRDATGNRAASRQGFAKS